MGRFVSAKTGLSPLCSSTPHRQIPVIKILESHSNHNSILTPKVLQGHAYMRGRYMEWEARIAISGVGTWALGGYTR